MWLYLEKGPWEVIRVKGVLWMGPWSHRTDVPIRRGRDTWDVRAEEWSCEGRGGRGHLQARKRGLRRNLTLDIQPPQLWGNKFLISYPVGLWCFIVGACVALFAGWVTPLLGFFLLISIWRCRLDLLSQGTRNSSLCIRKLWKPWDCFSSAPTHSSGLSSFISGTWRCPIFSLKFSSPLTCLNVRFYSVFRVSL